MIPVKETKQGEFEVLSGNIKLLSLDGKEQANLAVLLHESWSDEDRARFGVFLVEPFVVPEGKVLDGELTFERQNGRVVQVAPVKDFEPEPKPTVEQVLEGLGISIAELREALEVR